jgi:6-phosphogluconolactonase (cycloisomerase 2 family)
MLYVTTQGDSLISTFRVNLDSGQLTDHSTGIATGTLPVAAVFAPSGNVIFVLNGDCSGGSDVCNSISAYNVDSDGSIAAAGTTPVNGINPTSMAFNSDGSLLFVACPGSDTISVFTVSGTSLTEQTGVGFPFPVLSHPTAIAVPSNASFLYVTNSLNATVSAYSFDTNGALTPIFNPPANEFAVGTNPAGLVITPKGTFLYVADFTSNDVFGFEICSVVSTGCLTADGSLVPVQGTPTPVGLGPMSMAIDPLGQFLYVANFNSHQISGFLIASGTGTLSTMNTPTIATGTNPSWVAVHPSGKFAYVANNGAATVSEFTINGTSGVLGVIGTPVTVSNQPSAIVLR